MHTPSLLPFLSLLVLSLSALSSATDIDSDVSKSMFAGVRRSELNGPCTGKGGAPGVCVPTGKCASAGGSFISDACPGTPEDIKCCTKTSCGSGGKGNCRFTSSCASGLTETNQCPGPDNFKCCMPAGSSPPPGGSGNYPPPTIPSSSSGCKAVSIEGAKKIVAQFPGAVREIGCTRKCGAGESSDHCDGMAVDLMVTEGGGKTTAGQPLAEYIKNNCASFKCKYVMWGQRIWEKGVTGANVKWADWPFQKCTTIPNCVNGNRGGNTANHWDHVHVSFQ